MSPTINHAGRVQIDTPRGHIVLDVVDDQLLPEEDYTLLVGEIRAELLDLLLDTSSVATIEHSTTHRVSARFLTTQPRALEIALAGIMRAPVTTMTETMVERRVERLRHRPATLRELVLHPDKRAVRYMEAQESLDTMENRYVHYWSDILHKILESTVRRRLRVEDLRKYLRGQIERLDEQEHQPMHLDGELLNREYQRMEARRLEWQQSIISASNGITSDQNTKPPFCFTVIKSSEEIPNRGEKVTEVIVNDLKRADTGESKLPPDETAILRFYCPAVNADTFTRGINYELRAAFTWRSVSSNITPAHDHLVFDVIKIEDIVDKSWADANKKFRLKLDTWEKAGWKRHRTPDELKGLQRQRAGLQSRVDALDSEIQNAITLSGEVSQALHALERTIVWCRMMNIGKSKTLPRTIVFSTNPWYRSFHRLVDDICADDSELIAEVLEEDKSRVGIVDLPLLYERWCLLRLIRVLFDRFQFLSQGSWKTQLVRSCTAGKSNECSVRLRRKDLGITIDIRYQATINKRNGATVRPDIILDVKVEPISSISEELSGIFSPINRTIDRRFVVDAKYQPFAQAIGENRSFSNSSIGETLQQLVLKKDYSEGGRNPVFILHPSSDVGVERTNTEPWSKHSYYHGTQVFGWDSPNEMHTRGFVLVRPGEGIGESNDHLQRMLMLFLQYSIVDNTAAYTDPVPVRPFCPLCGGSDVDCKSESYGQKKAGDNLLDRFYVTYKCKNGECDHSWERHYCWACGNRLWKHGPYWTYHDKNPASDYDIKCPKCGSFLLDSKSHAGVRRNWNKPHRRKQSSGAFGAVIDEALPW